MRKASPDPCPPRVFVVVLNWNGWEDTLECIDSLLSVSYPDFEILIVDNGSTDGSVKRIRSAFPEVSVIQNRTNMGYAGGNNRGLDHAFSRGADYAVLLNNDTVVDPDFITELVLAAESEERPGLLSSKIFFYHEPRRLWFAGGTFSLFTGRSTHIGFNQLDDGSYADVTETERVCGCSMMLSLRFYENVGPLDEEYFCYCEETDLSLRGRSAGYRNIFVPASVVYHKVSRSTGGSRSGGYLYYSVRNTLKCLDKNDPAPFGFIRVIAVLLVYLLSLFTMGIPKLTGISNIFSGFRDYLLKRYGKRKFEWFSSSPGKSS